MEEKIECYKCGKLTPRNKLNEAILAGDSIKRLICDDCLKKMALKWETWLS